MIWSVRFVSLRLSVFAVGLVGATALSSAAAEEPSIVQLIEGVRNLTTADPELTAFSVRVSTILPFEIPFETTAVWQNDGDVGLLTTQGERRSPVWFLSNSQAAYFDVCSGSVLLERRKGRLRLKVQAPEKNKLSLNFGIGSGDEEEVDIDLRSLLDQPDFRDGTLSRPQDGMFVLESRVNAWGNRMIAYFDEEAPHPLRSLELKGSKGEGLFYVYDIYTNEEVDVRWPPMPAAEDFPAGIRVIDRENQEDAPDKVTQVLWFTRGMISYAALHNPKWREGPTFAGVDWDKAAEHARTFESLSPRLTAEFVEDADGQR